MTQGITSNYKGFEVIERSSDPESWAVIAGNGELFFICYDHPKEYVYSRPCGGGVYVRSQDLDYVAIGATGYKSIDAARKELAKYI